MKAIKVDWGEALKDLDTWRFVSQDIACDLLGREAKDLTMIEKGLRTKLISSLGVNKKDKYLEDAPRSNEFGVPIYNYAYPLTRQPEDLASLRVALETNCCVVKNEETDEYFLSLTGCGMDLSQDIGYAYILLNERIPVETALDINTQKGLSIGEKKFKVLAKEVIKTLKISKRDADFKIGSWRKAVKGDKNAEN